TPPGSLKDGAVHIAPGADAITVTFGLEGEMDEKVRVEVYHPDATERVEPAIVTGWFAMHRNRRTNKGRSGQYAAVTVAQGAVAHESIAQQAVEEKPARVRTEVPPASKRAGPDWRVAFEDADYAKAFDRIERQQDRKSVV